MRTEARSFAPLLPVMLLLACGPESDEIVFALQAHSFQHSEWSTPMNLGTMINTGANEQGPSLSNDGLSLYFGSDRPGGSGAFDLYVARRTCTDCPWETPVNLGSVINSPVSETGPNVSIDGHLLLFTSPRAGGQGGQDLYLSQRADPTDDFNWGAPEGLGTSVNTVDAEAGVEYLVNAEPGIANVYFNRAPTGGTADIYRAWITRDGETRGPATLIPELSHPTATDQGVTLRMDARELIFFSTRPGGFGGNDLWTSARQSARDPWSVPVNLGATLNSPAADQQPSLSFGGDELLFASSRVGSFGGTDIWMSTRAERKVAVSRQPSAGQPSADNDTVTAGRGNTKPAPDRPGRLFGS